MLSLAHRLAARLEQIDDLEDGGGFILDRSVGAHISSYTGPHGWHSDAGHEVPSSEPCLRTVQQEIASVFLSLPSPTRDPASLSYDKAVSIFRKRPTMRALLELATIVDRLTPLYGDINPRYEADSFDGYFERDWQDRDE